MVAANSLILNRAAWSEHAAVLSISATEGTDTMGIHVDYDIDISELPVECIEDCSSSGDVSETVEYWRDKLDITVNRTRAIECLSGYGAWEDEELAAWTDEKIAEYILWLASGNFSDFMHWRRENPDEPEENASCGSDVFVLE